MPRARKWEIPDLKRSARVRANARKILSWRLADVLFMIDVFRTERSVESLHQLRIAVRRLRYPLETSIRQFPRSRMLAFLTLLNHVQDVAGTARDLDVMGDRIGNLAHDLGAGHDSVKHFVTLARASLEASARVAYDDAVKVIDAFLTDPILEGFMRDIRYDRYRKWIEARDRQRSTPSGA